jgi:outer membrane murein-binding lipoprotein Lpp
MVRGLEDDQGGLLAGEAAQLEWLAGDNALLRAEVDRLTGENRRLQARVAELTCQVEQLRRAAKRQAAPFSKDRPARNPRRPGRKPGRVYGRQGRRPVPQRIDRVVAVELPGCCPHCGERLEVERIACQYQEDLPPPRSGETTCYQLPIGRCTGCGRRVQPRPRSRPRTRWARPRSSSARGRSRWPPG